MATREARKAAAAERAVSNFNAKYAIFLILYNYFIFLSRKYLKKYSKKLKTIFSRNTKLKSKKETIIL